MNNNLVVDEQTRKSFIVQFIPRASFPTPTDGATRFHELSAKSRLKRPMQFIVSKQLVAFCDYS